MSSRDRRRSRARRAAVNDSRIGWGAPSRAAAWEGVSSIQRGYPPRRVSHAYACFLDPPGSVRSRITVMRTLDIARDDRAPVAARRALEEFAADVEPGRLDELRLLVTELVSNSVRHGDGDVVR